MTTLGRTIAGIVLLSAAYLAITIANAQGAINAPAAAFPVQVSAAD